VDLPNLPPLFVYGGVLVGFVVTNLLLAHLLGPRKHTPVKDMPYESGMDPIGDARQPFDVRFYLVAILFLVFDVELLFLYPWAVTARPAKLAAAAAATSEASEPKVIDATVAALQQSDFPAAKQLVESHGSVFVGVMIFIALLTLGLVYDWRKGVFRWQ